jgi:hypothetical protein
VGPTPRSGPKRPRATRSNLRCEWGCGTSSECAGRPAKSRWCKSTTMKEWRTKSAPSRVQITGFCPRKECEANDIDLPSITFDDHVHEFDATQKDAGTTKIIESQHAPGAGTLAMHGATGAEEARQGRPARHPQHGCRGCRAGRIMIRVTKQYRAARDSNSVALT